mmetsp:Transcript_31332/g.57817  ORF Transcript_31332/g.57817 Transcript_31332/m.57817 type:complete len:259 (-) Transcript_31332:272-1048(-)
MNMSNNSCVVEVGTPTPQQRENPTCGNTAFSKRARRVSCGSGEAGVELRDSFLMNPEEMADQELPQKRFRQGDRSTSSKSSLRFRPEYRNTDYFPSIMPRAKFSPPLPNGDSSKSAEKVFAPKYSQGHERDAAESFAQSHVNISRAEKSIPVSCLLPMLTTPKQAARHSNKWSNRLPMRLRMPDFDVEPKKTPCQSEHHSARNFTHHLRKVSMDVKLDLDTTKPLLSSPIRKKTISGAEQQDMYKTPVSIERVSQGTN